jgi:hypothetical protein
VVTPDAHHNIADPCPGFNPSVGILGGHTQPPSRASQPLALFQSLSRDSWWSHAILHFLFFLYSRVSIPQSGFLVVTLLGLYARIATGAVSIPQSGFLVVTPICQQGLWMFTAQFQSLSRDSWWSHPAPGVGAAMKGAVSIPQSGFLVVTL